jgi:superfamily II DNA/RNA helicase
MASRGVPVGALHGGKSQAVRTRTLADFKEGRTPALVATNVAARGIHVDDISLVVHIDAPTDPKDYVHRAGRTARAGESGTVVTFAAPRQQKTITSLTKRAGVDADVTRVRPGAQALVDITGSQEPSGVPWYPAPEKRAHKSGPRHFHHRGGSGGGSKPRGRGRRPSSS